MDRNEPEMHLGTVVSMAGMFSAGTPRCRDTPSRMFAASETNVEALLQISKSIRLMREVPWLHLDMSYDTPTAVSGVTAQFVDKASAVRFEFHTPYARPDLWLAYLEGARETYRAYGVDQALEFDEVRNGLSTTVFVVAMSPLGEVVAGARFLGPIQSPDEAHVCAEFAWTAGEEQVRQALLWRIPEGVIEFKGCWAQIGHPQSRNLSSALARSLVHAMRWLDVRYACCSAADHACRRWESGGGRVMSGLEPIPYPSEKYRTTVLWWDARRTGTDADSQQWGMIRQERLYWEDSRLSTR